MGLAQMLPWKSSMMLRMTPTSKQPSCVWIPGALAGPQDGTSTPECPEVNDHCNPNCGHMDIEDAPGFSHARFCQGGVECPEVREEDEGAPRFL